MANHCPTPGIKSEGNRPTIARLSTGGNDWCMRRKYACCINCELINMARAWDEEKIWVPDRNRTHYPAHGLSKTRPVFAGGHGSIPVGDSDFSLATLVPCWSWVHFSHPPPFLMKAGCITPRYHFILMQVRIGPLQDPVTWYGINYTGTQVALWDFQNKGTLTSPARLSFVLKVPLRCLRPSIIYTVPCDRFVQKAYSIAFVLLSANQIASLFFFYQLKIDFPFSVK